jgi:hypothetical protein
MSDHENETNKYVCDGCDGAYSTSFNLTKHMKKCKVIQQQQSREGFMMVIRDKELIIESQRKEVDSLRNQVMELKIELATERARNQAQLGGFVSMAMNQHHQQPVYQQPPPPQQVYIQPPQVQAPPPAPAPAPVITIEAEPPAPTVEQTPEKPAPAPKQKVLKPIDYIDEHFTGQYEPVCIRTFISQIRRDDDEYCCFQDYDLMSIYENGNINSSGGYGGEPETWVTNIIEREFNKNKYPLSNRPFHSIKNSHGKQEMNYYDSELGGWVENNDEFEKKLCSLLKSMSTVLHHRIVALEEPAIEHLNEENRMYRHKIDAFGELVVFKIIDEYQPTAVMRDALAALNHMSQNPYKLMSLIKQKFILDTDMILEDMKDRTKKIIIKSKE